MGEQKRFKVVLPGGGGFLGNVLAEHFSRLGWEVVILSRQARPVQNGVRVVQWDGRTIGAWASEMDGADAVVNLAGRTVNCRYTAAHKHEIYDSRLASTRIVGEAIAAAARRPAVWINSSSATVYRHAEDRPQDEPTGEIGPDFSPDVVMKWEKEFFGADVPGMRKVAIRTAIVLGARKGTAFSAFYHLARWGLGGKMGSGRQMVSWVHEGDFARAVQWLIEHREIDGIVNIAAPNPIPNRDFMKALRDATGAKIGLPAARWMLEVGAFVMRTETELLLKSRWVVPARLLGAGFGFQFPRIEAAVRDLAAKMRRE